MAESAWLDVMLLSRGRALVGSFGGHMTRLAWELMVRAADCVYIDQDDSLVSILTVRILMFSIVYIGAVNIWWSPKQNTCLYWKSIKLMCVWSAIATHIG